jgi:hypothetical protein
MSASLPPWQTATFDTAVAGLSAVAGLRPSQTNTAIGDDVYDALNPKGRRRTASTTTIKPEDLLMNSSRRDQMDANAQDVHRNFSLLQWMIRQTINYCTLFDFHPTTKDEALNKDLRFLMTRDCEPENNDYVGRMSWDDMRSVAESLKIVAGDCHIVPIQEGTLQLIEGSYCRDPRDKKDGRWLSGAKLNARNRVMAWNFREFDMSSGYHASNYRDREVPASRVWQHIQYEQRANLVRGLSSISAALNEMRDLYETMDLARAKIKLEQLFGIAIFRNPDDDEDIADAVNENGAEEDTDPETEQEEFYDFGKGAPVVMDRTVGEKVEILQANSPGSNTIEFMRLCIQLVMLALDLPANFYNPSETNFFGSQAAWTLFERSCHRRRQSQLRLHKRMTRWRQWRWILPTELNGTGEIALPRSMSIDDLTYKWVPRGVPFWKPTEQLSAGLGRVAAGLTTMQGLCDETGSGLFEENLQNLRHELTKAEKLGFRMRINTARLDVTLEDMLAKPAPETVTGKNKPAKAGAA